LKILIVEFSVHYRIVKHLYKMLETISSSIKVIIKKDSSTFEVTNKEEVKNENLLYWKLIFNNYDLIFLSTGPEFREYTRNIFFLLGFFFFSVFNKNKIILQIRNLDQYEKRFNICYLLRYYSMRIIKRVVLDSKQIEENFHKKFKLNKKTSFVSFYYPDVEKLPQVNKKTTKIVIGMIGLDENRRDYDLLISVLKDIDTSNFVLKIIGNLTKEHLSLIKKFQEVIEVDYELKGLTDKEFFEKALSVDIFIAPLKKVLGYGVTKESGNFGDAILLNKKIIVPKFSCKTGEFDFISFYYSNKKELIEILNDLDNLNLEIDQRKREFYYSNNILNKLRKDLDF